MKIKYQDELSIILAGEAGKGIQTSEVILTKLLKRAGYNVFATKEYMSRVRGGSNSTEIRIASRLVASFVDRIDILIPFDKKAADRLIPRISKNTLIIGDNQHLSLERDMIDIPFTDLANNLGNPILTNIIAVGFILGLLNIDIGFIKSFLSDFFTKKGSDIIEKNIQAIQIGWNMGLENCSTHNIIINIDHNNVHEKDLLIDGHQAIALGAIAGGCNFVAAYPMSPSTGVLTFLAQHAEPFGIIVEQAEDEISAINMSIGSWYAGGRALSTTSGGGFALMTEGLSLAGCIESPLVIHLAQRPGPATGLPTRTEQGDLEVALYSGHGEFPRVLLAPGNLQDAFLCAQHAFEIADKYQIPVIILTDQFLLDSYYNIPDFPQIPQSITNHIVETTADYKRFQLTENGISERGIPGHGKGIVCADSDEHDEAGCITEDFQTRITMMDKRLGKLKLLKQTTLEPEFYGNENYKKLIISWGSTYHPIREALLQKGDEDIGYLYFKQIYPLPEKICKYWQKAEEVVVVENNATGQFENLIKREFGLSATQHIRKYNGMPFSVEEFLKQL